MSRSVPEWIGRTDNVSVPQRVRDRVRERDGNACCGCGRDLRNESSHCDHVEALINGGGNRETNLQTLCRWCHAEKTGEDVRIKARTYRRKSKHRGMHRSRRLMSGWKTFGGSPVRNPKLEQRRKSHG